MALYRIFPDRDAFIFSEQSDANTGKDEILELAGYVDGTGTVQASRILIKFADEDIKHVVDNIIITGSYTSTLGLYLANASEIPQEYNVNAYPLFTDVTLDWVNGTGKNGDLAVDRTGVSWDYISQGIVDQAWELGLIKEGLATDNLEAILID